MASYEYVMDATFSHCLDDDCVAYFSSKKWNVIRFAKQHFTKGVDFEMVTAPNPYSNGSPVHSYYFTEGAMQLLKSSYKQRSASLAKDRRWLVAPRLMSLETSTLSFIYEMLADVTDAELQYKCGPYYVDMYIPEYRICIECDELGHVDRAPALETTRQAFIETTLDAVFIRYDPTVSKLELPKLVGKIMAHMLKRKVIATASTSSQTGEHKDMDAIQWGQEEGERPQPPSKLSQFMAMDGPARGCDIERDDTKVTLRMDFDAVFKERMQTKLVADPAAFEEMGYRVSSKMEHVCMACKQLPMYKGTRCCAEYDSVSRRKKHVIYGMHMRTRQ